jgi:hypothetical protein
VRLETYVTLPCQGVHITLSLNEIRDFLVDIRCVHSWQITRSNNGSIDSGV